LFLVVVGSASSWLPFPRERHSILGQSQLRTLILVDSESRAVVHAFYHRIFRPFGQDICKFVIFYQLPSLVHDLSLSFESLLPHELKRQYDVSFFIITEHSVD